MEKLINKILIRIDSLIYFILLPLLIWAYLVSPRLFYAIKNSHVGDEFTASYINFNFNFVMALVGCLIVPICYFIRRAQYVIIFIISLLYFIRSLDVGLKEKFGISFSSHIFHNLSKDSITLFFEFYYFDFLLVSIFSIMGGVFISFFINKIKINKRLILSFMFFLFGMRGVYILYEERYYSFESIPSYLLVKEYIEYSDYKKNDKINLSNEEILNLKNIGLYPETQILNKNALINKNIIMIYLESFNANFTKKGGGIFEDLTPNLDKLIENSIFYNNYWSSAPGTHESIISSMCGTYSRIGPEYIRENPEYTTGNVCIFDFLDELNYKKYFLVGHHLGYSGLKTFFKNKGVNVVDSTYFIKYHPELIDIGTHWGIQDTDYARWLAEEIEKISSRDEKFFIGGFFINTHSPFFTAPDCDLYKENNKQLNSIHCVDQAVGILWEKILKLKLIDNSIIILLGDTPGIDPVTKKWDPYSKPLMLVRTPGGGGGTSKVNFHTPDVGVTLMELIGTNIQKMNIGHSAISLRKDKQFLVSEGYIIDSGKFSRLKKCIKEDSKEIKVNKFLLYNPCYVDRTMKYLHQIFIDNDINKKMSPK